MSEAPRRGADGILLILFSTVLCGLWLLSMARRLSLESVPRLQGLITAANLVLPHGYLLLLFASLPLCATAHRRKARLLSGLVLASIVWQWGGTWVPRPAWEAHPEQRLKVATWNVARLGEFCGRGECAAEEAAAMDCVREELALRQPDVLALQEISLRRLEHIEQALGWRCHLPTGKPAWIDYEGNNIHAHGGVAVCVPEGGTWSLQSLQHPALPPSWHYIFTEIQKGDRLVNFLSVHFKPPRLGRSGSRRALQVGRGLAQAAVEQSAQANRLLQTTDRFQDPTILAGDFNSTRDTPVHTGLRDHFIDTWEYGGWGYGATRFFAGLPLRIDYVYASTPHFSVHQTRRGTGRCSDHRPVFATVELR